MNEQRRFTRWQIDSRAQLELDDGSPPEPCTIHDLNYKGAKISMARKISPDTMIKLSISLAPDCSINAEVWIVWHRSIDGHNLYGVYFAKITDPDKVKLNEFVHKNFPKAITGSWWQGLERKEGGEQMQTKTFEDKRIFERLPVKLAMRFLDLNSNSEGEGTALDISAKGVGFTTAVELRPSTPIEMWLRFSDDHDPLYTRGEVTWSKPQGANEFRTGVNLERADLMGMSRLLR